MESKTMELPVVIKNKIVSEANWRSTNGHGGVDDITRDNFILAAEFGYQLACEEIKMLQQAIKILKALNNL